MGRLFFLFLMGGGENLFMEFLKISAFFTINRKANELPKGGD